MRHQHDTELYSILTILARKITSHRTLRFPAVCSLFKGNFFSARGRYCCAAEKNISKAIILDSSQVLQEVGI